MAYKHNISPFSCMSLDFKMNFRDQWASSIKIHKFSIFCFVFNCFTNSMCTKDCYCVIWYFIDLFDKFDAFSFQVLNNFFVMHNMVSNKDWLFVLFKRLFNNINCSINTSTKTSWVC